MSKRIRKPEGLRKLVDLISTQISGAQPTEKSHARTSTSDTASAAEENRTRHQIKDYDSPGTKAAALVPEDIRDRHERRTAPTLKTRSKQMSVYLERPLYRRLRECADREDTKMHPIIIEGILMALAKRDAAKK